MRQTLAIIQVQLRIALTNRGLVLSMLGLPLLLTVIFGIFLGGNSGGESAARRFPVAVVDEDGTLASSRLAGGLTAEKGLNVSVVTASDVPRLMADKKIDTAVFIPAGFQQQLANGHRPEVRVMPAPGSNLQAGVGPTIMREVTRLSWDYQLALRMAPPKATEQQVAEAYDRVAQERASVGLLLAPESVRRTDQAKTGPILTNLSSPALGFTVNFVMMAVMFLTGAILQERQNGTWGRMLVAPAAKAAVLTGFVGSFIVTGLVQFTVLVAAGLLLFGIQWGPLVPLFVVAAAFVFCCAGMGIFIAGTVRTPEQHQTVTIIITTALSMLGGVYWPLELMSETMQKIGYLTPQAWAMEGFREVMLRGGAWGSLVWPMGVLVALAVIFMAAGLTRVRYE